MNDLEKLSEKNLEMIKQEQEKVGKKYKSHLFSMFAQLFCTIAEIMIEDYAENGKNTIIKAVNKYGEERGKKIAERVSSLGKGLTLSNFFIYGDLDSKKVGKSHLKIVNNVIQLNVEKCVFYEACLEWNKMKFGELYCQFIDEAILRGYNPELQLKKLNALYNGDHQCSFEYLIKEKENY